ncbi:hypothetical protein ACHAXN_008962 [Cyclotella atomus]
MATPEIDATVRTDKSSLTEEKPGDECIDSGPTDANSDEKDVHTSEETNEAETSPGEADSIAKVDNDTLENGDASNNKEVTPAPQASETPAATPPEPETSESDPASSPSKEMRSKAFVYDPNKITLRFLFAGRDGIHVVIDFDPNDTVGEVKGALMSVWPEDMPECTGGDRIRLICMGKGILMPDSKTLKAAEVPVFKTHPTPINVSVRPEDTTMPLKHGGLGSVVSSRSVAAGDFSGNRVGNVDGNSSSGCCCVIC